MFVVFAGKTTKTRRKNARNLKKIQVRSDDDIFSKQLAKCTKFEVSSLGLGLELQVSSLSLGLGVFGEVSVASLNFNQVLVSDSKVMVSTTSLASMYVSYLALFCFLVVSRARVHFCCAPLIVRLALIVCDVALVLCASSFVQKSLFG